MQRAWPWLWWSSSADAVGLIMKISLQGPARIEFNAGVIDFAGRPCLLAGFTPHHYHEPLQCVCQDLQTPEMMVTFFLLSISFSLEGCPLSFNVLGDNIHE